jgi:uncharacterized protein YndB with AHSA1/START domain
MKNTGTLKFTTRSDREIEVTHTFEATRNRVFEAFTRPDLVKRWLLGPPGWSMPVCEIDLKVGGKFRYVWRKDRDGTKMGMGGVYRELAPPERIVHTELFDEDWTGGETLVTTVFQEKGGRTTVTTTVRYSSQEARDGALKIGMIEGWAQSYDRLAKLLASSSARGNSRARSR